jgi:ComEC/Rec2-related protein
MMTGVTNTSPRRGDIFFAITAAFLLGVLAENMGWGMLSLGLIGMFCAIAVVLFFRIERFWKYTVFLFIAAIAGGFYYHAYIDWHMADEYVPIGKDAAFFGIVKEEPRAAGNFTMFVVSLVRPYAGTVDIFGLPDGAQFQYGDEIWTQGVVTLSRDTNEPPTVFLPHMRLIAHYEEPWFKEAVINIKEGIVRDIARLLPTDEAALLSGIMVGTTGTMSAALKARMESSGTTYIVAMYGYKIAVIILALSAAFKNHVSRKILMSILLIAIALFVFASGGTVSAIRAGIMGSFAAIARGTGRMFNPRNALTFAAFGMVLMDATLLTDVGFQLSFLSFLGIYYLGPPINNYFNWTNGGMLQWKEHAMLSLSTNLAILPVVMNTFGGFSLMSFISNILIMIPWLAVIVFGTVLVVLGFVSPVLASCITPIVRIFLQYELFIIHACSAIAIPLPAVFGSSIAIALYYGALIIFAHYYATPSQKDH